MWRSLSRLTRCLILGTLGALIAVFAVDVTQAVRPEVYASCDQATNALLSRRQVYSRPECYWHQQRFQDDAVRNATQSVRVDQIADRDGARTVRVTCTLTLPAGHPLVTAVRGGRAAADPRSFNDVFCGYVNSNPAEVDWQPPTIALDPAQANAQLVVIGTTAARRGVTLEISVRPNSAVEVSTGDLRIASVAGVRVAVQHDAVLTGTADVDDRSTWTVGLATAGNAPPADYGYTGWPSVRAAVVDAVRFTLWPGLLGALPWLLLYLTVRGRGHRAPPLPWRRVQWLIRVVLVAHVVITAGSALTTVESQFPIRHIAAWLARHSTSTVDGFAMPARVETYPTVNGSVILLIAALAFFSARVVWRWPGNLTPGWQRSPHWYARRLFGWFLVAAGLLGVGCLIEVWMFDGTGTGVLTVAPLVLGVALVGLALLLVAGIRPRDRWLLPVLAPLVVALTMIAGIGDRDGLLAQLARTAVPVLAGAAALLGLAQAGGLAMLGRPALHGRRLLLALPVAVLLAVPMHHVAEPGEPNWWLALTVALRLDALLAPLLVAAVLVALWRLGRQPTTRPAQARWLRTMGLGCLLIVLTGGYSFGRQPSLVVLAVAALGAWLLLPAGQLAATVTISALSDDEQSRAVATVVRAGEARRALPALRKGLRDKVAGTDLTFAQAHAKVRELEGDASAPVDGHTGLTPEQIAFGLVDPQPWRRARWGAITGTVAGLPWTALTAYGAAQSLPTGDEYPVLAVTVALISLLIPWTAYGFGYGYWYPLIRGSTGLAKGLWLFAAIAAPTVADVIPAGASAGGWHAVVLTILETLSFAMTLGLLTDREVLRRRGRDARRLADVHNLGSVAAWASSVAVAGGTALATALLVGLQPFVAGLVQPQQPQNPPANVSTTNR